MTNIRWYMDQITLWPEPIKKYDSFGLYCRAPIPIMYEFDENQHLWETTPANETFYNLLYICVYEIA